MLIKPKSTMKQLHFICLIGFLVPFITLAQQTIVKGSVKNSISNQPLQGVHVVFEETLLSTDTDTEGEFQFLSNIPIGEHVLRLTKEGYLLGGGTETNQYGTTVRSLSENQINASVFRSKETYDITPLVVQIPQLSNDHIGMFVQIENTEFEANLAGERYFNPSENYDTSRTIQSCSEATYSTFDVETSSFSSFKNELLPTGNGTVAGIISKTYDGSRLVLALNNTDDVNMNNERCSL